jgi:Fe-S-cluster containining protein
MKFNCTKCGACCKNVGDVQKIFLDNPETRANHPAYKLILEFPYGFKEDGSTCEKYDPAVGCTIYERRPDVCNIAGMTPLYMAHFGWTEAQYYKEQAKNCNVLIITQEIPFKYLIPPGLEIIS